MEIPRSMPILPQNPLTATPVPSLDWSREGTPASSEFDDIYFSTDGGLAETRSVFLGGCGLPETFARIAQASPPEVFTVGELGFGSGLNFLAALDLWRSSGAGLDCAKRLHFVSVEAMPWSAQDLQRGLSYFPQLAEYADSLTAQWPGRVKGLHRLHFGNAALTLFHMDALSALNVMDANVDAWFLDGFSPSKNPDMWSDAVLAAIAERSNPGARLATFSVAGHVRRGLEAQGFSSEKKPGFGRKRHRLEAVFGGGSKADIAPNADRSHVIIGGGIAGASIARALRARGKTPILIDPEPDLDTAASGNPAAMVMPRLDLQDRPESRFFLSSYLYALARYRESGAVLSGGAKQFAQTDKEAKRFKKLAAQSPLPGAHMALQCETGPQPRTALHFQQAQLVDPKAVIAAWTEGCVRRPVKAASIETAPQLRVHLESGEIIDAEAVYICAGADVLDLHGDADVRFTRGQISFGPSGGHGPDMPMIYGGYAAPLGEDGLLLGATHAHVGPGSQAKVLSADQAANKAGYEALADCILPGEGWRSRAAVRVTTKDTLPIAQTAGEGLYLLSGLGARGFMMAPLLAEALVCAALGEPSPLCQNAKMRFGAREVSKLQSASGSL